jgi:hypothetical protein
MKQANARTRRIARDPRRAGRHGGRPGRHGWPLPINYALPAVGRRGAAGQAGGQQSAIPGAIAAAFSLLPA